MGDAALRVRKKSWGIFVHESTERQYMEYVLEMYPELAGGGRQASTLETLVFDSLCPDARIRGPVEKESQGTERVIHAVSRGRKHDAPKDEAVESLSVVRSRKHFRHLCRPDAAAPLEHRPGVLLFFSPRSHQ